MPRLAQFVVADSFSVDQSTNRLSIFNVLEAIGVPSFPLVYPEAAVISTWMMAPADLGKDFQVLLRVTFPGGIRPAENAANLRGSHSRHRILQRLIGLPLTETGQIRFELLLNGHSEGEYLVDVQTQPAPPDLQSPMPS
jgi:hypothetical protein